MFRGDCGLGLYATSPTHPVIYSLWVGVIAQRASFRAAQQIWCHSALPWTADVPGLEKRERQ